MFIDICVSRLIFCSWLFARIAEDFQSQFHITTTIFICRAGYCYTVPVQYQKQNKLGDIGIGKKIHIENYTKNKQACWIISVGDLDDFLSTL